MTEMLLLLRKMEESLAICQGRYHMSALFSEELGRTVRCIVTARKTVGKTAGKPIKLTTRVIYRIIPVQFRFRRTNNYSLIL